MVLLEVTGEGRSGEMGAGDVKGLLHSLDPGPCGGALHSRDRYVLQVTARGSGPLDALADVLARWEHAVERRDLPRWKVVRTEVFTPEELEREFADAECADILVPAPSQAPSEGHNDLGRELLLQAFSDPLTGLLTSGAFAHRLGTALGGDPSPRGVAVVWVNIDGFRAFDARFGSEGGDEILVSVAERLVATLRSADALARFGGDDFAVLLEDTTEGAALAVAGRILEAVRRPVTIGDTEVAPSCSAGVAVAGPGDDSEEVLRRARAALAVAKGAGGGCSIPHRPDTCQRAETRRELRAGGLRDPLAHVQLLRDAALTANDAETLTCAAQVVMPQICALVGCDIGHLSVASHETHDDASTRLWYVRDDRVYRSFQEATEEGTVRPGVGLADRVFATGRPVYVVDLEADEDFAAKGPAAACGLRSGFAFPVLVGSEVVAVFEFFARTQIERAGPLLDVVTCIGIQLGRIVERQRAQHALRESELQLRDAQQLADIDS